MARALLSLIVLLCVTFLAGLVTMWGLQSTGLSVAKLVALSSVKANVRPSYVSSLTVAKPQALNVATLTPVFPDAAADVAGKALPAPPEFTHTVAIESLRVRSGPGKMTPQIFALKGGAHVTSIREEAGWVMVDAGDGRIGWVYHKFLRPAAAGGQSQANL